MLPTHYSLCLLAAADDQELTVTKVSDLEFGYFEYLCSVHTYKL